MKNLISIGLLILLFQGCTHLEIPEEWVLHPALHTTKTTEHQRHQQYGQRSLHPLSYVRQPEPHPITPLPPLPEPSAWDSYRQKKLRHQGVPVQPMEIITPSLFFPLTKRPFDSAWLINPLPAISFQSMITLSSEQYFHLQLDNDIFNYTDRFFTNGIRMDLIAPFLRYNPLSWILIPYWHQGTEYFGLRFVQHIYTPSNTKSDTLLPGDRPYAGYLFAGTYKISSDATRRFRITSELQLGIIGPSSLAGALQIAFHTGTPQNHPPIGWEMQIQNDLLLNYLAKIEQGILSTDALEINLQGKGSIGTVYTYLQGGLYLRSGLFNPYFNQLFFSARSVNQQKGFHSLQCYVFLDLNGQLTGYDATLQGGMLNRTSPYIIPSNEMNRLLFQGSAGIVFSLGGLQIKGEQFLLSPEFYNGWWHKWLSLAITVSF